MSPATIAWTALASISSNKLRAGLTLLGIVIGVASVITLMAIGRGAQQQITSRIQDLGTNLLFVRPGAATQGLFSLGQGSATTLTLEDALALEDDVFAPDVLAAAPETQFGAQLVFEGENVGTQGAGVTESYLEVRNLELASGRAIAGPDVANRSEVAVLGHDTAESLFGPRDPVGAAIRINGRLFTVIGVLEERGGTSFGNQDDIVLVPITTGYYRLAQQNSQQGGVTVQSINVQATDESAIDRASEQLRTVLRLRHRLDAGAEDDFTITNQQETLETLEETTSTFVIFLGAIAGISLIVGGIGIMNIMIVSVTERTREIGIRRAIGARRIDILLQFLTEATLLSVGGGLAGAAGGLVLSRLIDGKSIGSQAFTTVIQGDVVILALSISAAIGLFFGIYPAYRASRLKPVDALRSE